MPAFSQMVHDGTTRRTAEAAARRCSPTSLAMVLAYYEALPGEAETAWVGRAHVDRVVDHVARMTYDHGYDGTGNWPFNTAYAATLTHRRSSPASRRCAASSPWCAPASRSSRR